MGVRKAASAAALKQLARNGIGVGVSGQAVNACAPSTVEEVAALPAVMAILGLLDREARERGERESQSSAKLRSAQGTAPGSKERAQFMDTAGLSIIMWIRHVEARVFFAAARWLVRRSGQGRGPGRPGGDCARLQLPRFFFGRHGGAD